MVAEVVRVLLVLAERVVRIHPQFLRAAAGEVLHRQGDASLGVDRRAFADRRALQALDQRLHDVRIQVGVLGEYLVGAVPARLGQEVGHVAVHRAQADRVVLGAHHFGEGLDHRHVAGGRLTFLYELLAQCGRGKAGFLRELRERAAAGSDALARVGLDMVARVVLEHHRDPEPGLFREFLHGIGIRRQLLGSDLVAAASRHHAAVAGVGRRCRRRAQDEAGHLLVVDVVERRRRHRTRAAGIVVVDHHHPDLLLRRHLRHEIIDAGVDRKPPILVGIELAIGVEVLELVAADGQYGLRLRADRRLRDERSAIVVTAAATGNQGAADQRSCCQCGRNRPARECECVFLPVQHRLRCHHFISFHNKPADETSDITRRGWLPLASQGCRLPPARKGSRSVLALVHNTGCPLSRLGIQVENDGT